MLSRALANRRLRPLGHPSTDEWGRHGVCPSGSSERPPPSQFGASQFAPPEQTGCYDRRHGMPNAPLLSQRTSDDDFARLIDEIRACRLCAAELPLGPRPIVRGRPDRSRQSMTATLSRWREFLPEYFVLPHPSWRTTAWERKNPWFASEVLPQLRAAVGKALG